jgi:hypothetical protein
LWATPIEDALVLADEKLCIRATSSCGSVDEVVCG